jgi:hypothetical protein
MNGSRRLPPDLVIEALPGTGLYVVRPCHRRAAEWLMLMAGDVPVDDRRIESTVLDALTAGFNVSFAFARQPRLLGGLPAGPAVE